MASATTKAGAATILQPEACVPSLCAGVLSHTYIDLAADCQSYRVFHAGASVSSPLPGKASSSPSAHPYSSTSSPSESATSSNVLFRALAGLRKTLTPVDCALASTSFARILPLSKISKQITFPVSPVSSLGIKLRPWHFWTPTNRPPKSRNTASLVQTPESHSPPPTPGTRAEPRALSLRVRDAHPVDTATATLFRTAILLRPETSEPSTAYRRPACHFCCSVFAVPAKGNRG